MEIRRGNIKKDIIEKLSSNISRLKINEPIKNHSSFRIGGPAKYYVEVKSIDELKNLVKLIRLEKLNYMVIGSGSNLLFSDHGFDGVIIKLIGEFSDFQFKKNKLSAGSGVNLGVLVNRAMEKSLAGMEDFAGIPGTLGGAIIGNAGSKDVWIGSKVNYVKVLNNDGKVVLLKKKTLKFSYRNSNLEGNIVLNAEISLKKGRKNVILKKIDKLMIYRSKMQPLSAFCAGSIFKNPKNHSAGALIEQAGIKGIKFGGAKISEKHGNFIINDNNAKASDVLALITMARQKVKEKFGINLELEIKVIG